jgi:GT2 family glycosyltransferase
MTTRSGRHVCIVARAPGGQEDAGDFVSGLIRQLGESDTEITLCAVPGWMPIAGEDHRDGEPGWDSVRSECAGRFRFVELAPSPLISAPLRSYQKVSLAIREFLRGGTFDRVYFALEGGLAFYSILARQTSCPGADFEICVAAARPIRWVAEVERFLLSSQQDFACAYMEKYCLEHADQVISPTRYLVDWLRSSGTASRNVAVAPDLWAPDLMPATRQPASARGPFGELVFWSRRHSEAAGFLLFCDTVDALVRTGVEGLRLTVFGELGDIRSENSGAVLLRRAEAWPYPLALKGHASSAELEAYLGEPGRLSIWPLPAANLPQGVLRSTALGLPFVATEVGGIPELPVRSDLKQFIAPANPAALADCIARILPDGRAATGAVATLALPSSAALLDADIAADRPRAARRTRNPLVSVILPHRDRPHLLRQALRSLFEQTYEPIEVVLVDDGSTLKEAHDLLADIAPEFERRGWKIIRQENKWLGAARNAGIRAASGDLLLFLDDDDIWLPHAAERLVEAIESTQADICPCFYSEFHGDQPAERLEPLRYLPIGGCLELGFLVNCFGGANALIRRSVFERIGYFREERGLGTEDWELYARATFAGLKLIVVPEILYRYRINSASMYQSSHWLDDRRRIIELYRRNSFRGAEDVAIGLLNWTVAPDSPTPLQKGIARPSETGLRRLRTLAPDSPEAKSALSAHAAKLGRPWTASALAEGDARSPEDSAKVIGSRVARESAGEAVENAIETLTHRRRIPADVLRRGYVIGRAGADVDKEGRTVLDASREDAVMVIPGAVPRGSVRLSAAVELDAGCSAGVAELVLVEAGAVPPGPDIPPAALTLAARRSARLLLDESRRSAEAVIELARPTDTDLDLVLCAHAIEDVASHVAFSAIALRQKVGERELRRPRGEPARVHFRALGPSVMKRVSLIGSFPEDHAPLSFLEDGTEFLLWSQGADVVAATLGNAFPGLARELVAEVEIPVGAAGPVDCALMLASADLDPSSVAWPELEAKCRAFSGWNSVDRPLEIRRISVEVPQPTRSALQIIAAVRGPSKPEVPLAWKRFLIFADL